MRAFPRALNSRGNNLRLEVKLEFFVDRSYVQFMQFEKSLSNVDGSGQRRDI